MNHYKRWVIYTAAVFMLISATLVSTPNLYFMAALLLTLPFISYALGMFALQGLEFDRETPASTWEGETATFHLVVRSRARLPRLFLQAADNLPDSLVAAESQIMFNVAPGAVIRIPYRVEMTKRGAYTIEGMRVTALDPLGIFSFTRTYHTVSEVLVYPTPQIIPEFSMSGSERYGFQELQIAATKGSGVDPDGVREYVPGDPLRRVHWKSTARTGKLSVIEFEESRAVNIVVVLDLFRVAEIGEGRQSTTEYSVLLAASLAQAAIRQGASVRLITGEEGDIADFAGRGSEHLYMILTSLARAQAIADHPISAGLTDRIGPIQPGTTLVIITADTDSELPGAIAHYTSAGVQCCAMYVDPRSFRQGLRSPTESGQQGFFANITAAQAPLSIVRMNEERVIKPEQSRHALTFA